MEKEFTPYAEALALKELGFDETCIGFYNIKGISVSDYKVTKLQIDSLGLEKCCLAPLYQQAFRWFREKYRLDAIIDVGVMGYRANIVDRRGKFLHIAVAAPPTEYIYEEAELECLKKLIEIVKNK